MNHFLILRFLLLIPATLFCQVMLGQYYFDKLTEEQETSCFNTLDHSLLFQKNAFYFRRRFLTSFEMAGPMRGESMVAFADPLSPLTFAVISNGTKWNEKPPPSIVPVTNLHAPDASGKIMQQTATEISHQSTLRK